MAEGTSQRGGRLSGLIPLVVVGIIVFLFFRSCFEGVPSIPFFGSGDDDEEQAQPETTDTDAPSDAELDQMEIPVAPECPPEEGATEAERHLRWTKRPPMCLEERKTYTAKLETERGPIIIELDFENAPTTVNNFVYLARWGFYDEMEFHAVVPGVSIQTGDPTGEPPEDRPPGYTFEGELPDEEPYYPLYSVAMGGSGDPGIHSSTFFIVTGTETRRQPVYSRFGQITDETSKAVVDAIDKTGETEVDEDTPNDPTIIESVTITER